MREQTQWMLLLHPTDVPHLSRLQPPFGSASSQAILLHLKAPGQPEGIPSECFSSWNRKRYWDTTLRYIINLTWENRKKSSCFRWPNGTRSFQQQCSLSFTCYFHDEEFQNLDIGTSWDFTLFSHSSLAAAQPEQRYIRRGTFFVSRKCVSFSSWRHECLASRPASCSSTNVSYRV